MNNKRFRLPSTRRQRGVVLLFCLIILVILLAGGVAVVRSMNTSMFNAGNLAFKRDLVNQGEQAISKVLREFGPGGLLNAANATSANVVAANYSAVQLEANARGIPTLLLKQSGTLSGPDLAGATFTPGVQKIDGNGGVAIRYVIDRLCNEGGSFATLGSTRCVYSPIAVATGGTAGEDRPSVAAPPLYRVTVRVDGPRNTQVFLQSSFSKPE